MNRESATRVFEQLGFRVDSYPSAASGFAILVSDQCTPPTPTWPHWSCREGVIVFPPVSSELWQAMDVNDPEITIRTAELGQLVEWVRELLMSRRPGAATATTAPSETRDGGG